jgi:hypothetical protein
MRCVSSMIGSELFIEEIMGYSLMGIVAISNEKVYNCLNAIYREKYPPNSQKEYVPKSQRKKNIVYLWWLELYDAIESAVWHPIVHVLSSVRISKKIVARRSPWMAYRRLAPSSTRSLRRKGVGCASISHIRRKVAENTHRVISKCYVTNDMEQGYGTTSQGPFTASSSSTFCVLTRQEETDQWDTDSVEVKVDSGCSMSLSGDIKDFLPGTLRPMKGKVCIQSFGGSKTVVTHSGTIVWKVMDDSNIKREIKLPGALYVPGCKTKLLSPQHLAQVTDRPGTPLHSKTKATAYGDSMVLQWTVAKFKKTVKLDNYNLGTM